MFIRQTEQLINRELRAPEQIVWGATLTTSSRTGAGLPTYTLPTNFIAERVFWNPDTTKARPLESKNLGELRSINIAAPVTYYGLRGTVVEFRGNPADADVIEYDYFAEVPAVSATPGANIMLDTYEELYLAGGLFWLYRYTQDVDMAQAFLDSFGHARDTINALAMFKIGSQSVAPTYNFNVRGSF